MKPRTFLRAPRAADLSVPKLPPSSAAPRANADSNIAAIPLKPFSELEECRRTRADIEKGIARCEAALAARKGQSDERSFRRALAAERARLRRFERLVALQERLERANARLARAATCTCGLREACEAAARARVARVKLVLAQLGLRNFQISIAETRQMLAAPDDNVDIDAVKLQLKALLAILPNVESRLAAAQKEAAELA